MRVRRFYTFSCWYGCSCKGLFLSCGDIWCSILVYHYLFAVCALLVSLVVCCSACLLIMRYRANNSPFLLVGCPYKAKGVFYLSILKGIISSCVVWSIIIVCALYGIVSSACKAFISFLLHILLFGGRLCCSFRLK